MEKNEEESSYAVYAIGAGIGTLFGLAASTKHPLMKLFMFGLGSTVAYIEHYGMFHIIDNSDVNGKPGKRLRSARIATEEHKEIIFRKGKEFGIPYILNKIDDNIDIYKKWNIQSTYYIKMSGRYFFIGYVFAHIKMHNNIIVIKNSDMETFKEQNIKAIKNINLFEEKRCFKTDKYCIFRFADINMLNASIIVYDGIENGKTGIRELLEKSVFKTGIF